MHSSKYILWQEDNGWRGYIEGCPEREMYAESFEDLQLKLWHLHQELTGRDGEREPAQYPQTEHHRHHNQTPTIQAPRSTRPMTRTQQKRRAQVEQLLFGMISNR